MHKINLNIKNNISLHILFIGLISFVVYFVFNLSFFSVLGYGAGILMAILTLIQIPKLRFENSDVLIIFICICLSYFFYNNFTILSSFLLGLNLMSFYLSAIYDTKKENTPADNSININLINTIFLTSLVIESAIEKFRGSNKLALNEISLAIPLIILVIVAYNFLSKIFINIKKTKQIEYDYKQIIITSIYFLGAFWLISQFLFKEVGSYIIFGPLFSGLVVYILEYFKSKYNITYLVPFIIFFLLSYPYIVSGLLGITITALCAILLIHFSNDLNIKESSIIYVLFPVIFLFAAAEFRENLGVITRFNLATGSFMSQVLIGMIIIITSIKYFPKLKKIVLDNEILNTYAFFKTAFTIIVISLIIKYGLMDLLIGGLIGASFYILGEYYIHLLNNKKPLHNTYLNYSEVYNLLNLIGSIVLMLLIRI